jgi:transposase
MPWKERVTLDLRTKFVLKSLSKDIVFRDLCKEYGISTKTGYKWQRRFTQNGVPGLHDKSRRPHSNPACLPEDTVCDMVKLKSAHPDWGPNKIHEIYRRTHVKVL